LIDATQPVLSISYVKSGSVHEPTRFSFEIAALIFNVA
jgi:hypothetical protein